MENARPVIQSADLNPDEMIYEYRVRALSFRDVVPPLTAIGFLQRIFNAERGNEEVTPHEFQYANGLELASEVQRCLDTTALVATYTAGYTLCAVDQATPNTYQSLSRTYSRLRHFWHRSDRLLRTEIDEPTRGRLTQQMTRFTGFCQNIVDLLRLYSPQDLMDTRFQALHNADMEVPQRSVANESDTSEAEFVDSNEYGWVPSPSRGYTTTFGGLNNHMTHAESNRRMSSRQIPINDPSQFRMSGIYPNNRPRIDRTPVMPQPPTGNLNRSPITAYSEVPPNHRQPCYRNVAENTDQLEMRYDHDQPPQLPRNQFPNRNRGTNRRSNSYAQPRNNGYQHEPTLYPQPPIPRPNYQPQFPNQNPEFDHDQPEPNPNRHHQESTPYHANVVDRHREPNRHTRFSNGPQPADRRPPTEPMGQNTRAQREMEWINDSNPGNTQEQLALRRWFQNKFYDGGVTEDKSHIGTEDLLESIRSYQLSQQVSDLVIIRNIGQTFIHGAKIWWRSRQYHVNTLNEFEARIRARFAPQTKDTESVVEAVHKREQKQGEPLNQYIDEVLALMMRAPDQWSETAKISKLKRGMLPEWYSFFIGRTFSDLATFFEFCEEVTKKDVGKPKRMEVPKRYPAPARKVNAVQIIDRIINEDSEISESESDSQEVSEQEVHALRKLLKAKRGHTNRPRSRDDSTKSDEIAPIQENEKLPAQEINDRQFKVQIGDGDERCWNCLAYGHRHDLCPYPKRIFCYGCGRPDTIWSKCASCQRKFQVNPSKNLNGRRASASPTRT